MRRLTLLISIALAILAVAIPATAGAKRSHHRSHHRARVADRNHNGIPDSWERKFHVRSATADPDRDGVTNLGEFHNGTNPRVADSNGNGIPDGQDDANGDGIPDGQEQGGTISSFDGTTLVVTLVDGTTQQGTVDGSTEIECEDNTPTGTAPTTATTRDGGTSTEQPEPGDDSTQTSTTSPTTSGDSETEGDDDQGDNNDDQGGDQQSSGCDTTALQPGTVVQEAELRLTSSGPVFEKIHLGGKAPA